FSILGFSLGCSCAFFLSFDTLCAASSALVRVSVLATFCCGCGAGAVISPGRGWKTGAGADCGGTLATGLMTGAGLVLGLGSGFVLATVGAGVGAKVGAGVDDGA